MGTSSPETLVRHQILGDSDVRFGIFMEFINVIYFDTHSNISPKLSLLRNQHRLSIPYSTIYIKLSGFFVEAVLGVVAVGLQSSTSKAGLMNRMGVHVDDLSTVSSSNGSSALASFSAADVDAASNVAVAAAAAAVALPSPFPPPPSREPSASSPFPLPSPPLNPSPSYLLPRPTAFDTAGPGPRPAAPRLVEEEQPPRTRRGLPLWSSISPEPSSPPRGAC